MEIFSTHSLSAMPLHFILKVLLICHVTNIFNNWANNLFIFKKEKIIIDCHCVSFSALINDHHMVVVHAWCTSSLSIKCSTYI